MSNNIRTNPGISKNSGDTSFFPLWQIGFRPFFLFGMVSGVISLSIWVLSFTTSYQNIFDINSNWHAHEMIFGFVAAIIIGFLFTASQNWAGKRGIHGLPLIFVLGVWFLGRAVFLIPNIPVLAISLLDLAFLPIAGGLLGSFLWKANQKKNLIFLVLILFIWLGNILYHGDLLGYLPGMARKSLYFTSHIIVTMIIVLSGRIIPFFSRAAIPEYFKASYAPLDFACILSSILFAFSFWVDEYSLYTTIFSFFACFINLIRFLFWLDSKIIRVPILFILYVGYFWMILGFFLNGLASLTILQSSTALHVLTIGTISMMIIGMISRVSLGHTGRQITASPLIIFSYLLMFLGGAVRLFGQFIMGPSYRDTILISGVFWVLSLLVLLIVFTPILLKKRADGRPG